MNVASADWTCGSRMIFAFAFRNSLLSSSWRLTHSVRVETSVMIEARTSSVHTAALRFRLMTRPLASVFGGATAGVVAVVVMSPSDRVAPRKRTHHPIWTIRLLCPGGRLAGAGLPAPGGRPALGCDGGAYVLDDALPAHVVQRAQLGHG